MSRSKRYAPQASARPKPCPGEELRPLAGPPSIRSIHSPTDIAGETGHGAGAFIYPTDVALDRNGMLYVADGYANRIQVFDTAGNPVNKWGGPFAVGVPGPFNGWFRVVAGIAFGPRGDIFAADFYNHRLQKFRADGTFLTSFGGEGSGPGQFDHAMAVAISDGGTVYAVDFGNSRIQKWRPPTP